MDLTLGRRKSQTRSGSQNGARKPPLAASTWIGMSRSTSLLQLIQSLRDGLHRLVLAAGSHAECGYDHDGIFVTQSQRLFRAHQQTVTFERNLPDLDIEIAAELVPADLHRSTNQIRPVGRFALRAHPGSPAPFRRQTAEHSGLAGAGGGTSDGVRSARENSTNRREYERSGSRSRRFADIHPCRTYSCRCTRPSELCTSGSFQVVQKVARFWRAFPSSNNSSWMRA